MAKSKSDLVAEIIAESKDKDIISKAQVERLVDSVFDKITEHVIMGEPVIINKFGTFESVNRAARNTKTPQGVIVAVPETKAMKFRMSSAIKKKLN